MNGDRALLASVSTALDELTERVTGVADQYASATREDIAAGLYEVERSLLAANRRLARVLRELK